GLREFGLRERVGYPGGRVVLKKNKLREGMIQKALDKHRKLTPGWLVPKSESYIQRERYFYPSRGRHTRFKCDWSSDVCSSDLHAGQIRVAGPGPGQRRVAGLLGQDG